MDEAVSDAALLRLALAVALGCSMAGCSSSPAGSQPSPTTSQPSPTTSQPPRSNTTTTTLAVTQNVEYGGVSVTVTCGPIRDHQELTFR